MPNLVHSYKREKVDGVVAPRSRTASEELSVLQRTPGVSRMGWVERRLLGWRKRRKEIDGIFRYDVITAVAVPRSSQAALFTDCSYGRLAIVLDLPCR